MKESKLCSSILRYYQKKICIHTSILGLKENYYLAASSCVGESLLQGTLAMGLRSKLVQLGLHAAKKDETFKINSIYGLGPGPPRVNERTRK